MIKQTFQFLPKIGPGKNRQICKQAGDWEGFLRSEIKGISQRRKQAYDNHLMEAKRALSLGDSHYFYDKLPSSDTWRLYEHFKEETVFLDIEASGNRIDSFLTIVGLFDGLDPKVMIRGINLNMIALGEELKRYKLIVTFNGSSFDLPFLTSRYPGLIPKIPHIDVKHLCSRVGLVGGLKDIERQLGIVRKNKISTKEYQGDPLSLWKNFSYTAQETYLNTLLQYNEEDVVNLKKVMEVAISMMKDKLDAHENAEEGCGDCKDNQ